MIRKEVFGICDAGTVEAYTLENSRGTQTTVLTLGGTVQKLVVRGTDVCLGYDTLEEYLTGKGYVGAIIGRVANRIAGAGFSLNGREYRLFPNNGPHTLHGGSRGFDKKLWSARLCGEALVLSCVSPDGEEGFPGTLQAEVTYSLGEDDSLRIDYRATPDRDTPVNLTNHAYFNLDGGSSVLSHSLWVDAQGYTVADAANIPTGQIADVAGTALDFRTPQSLGARIHQLPGGYYDHNLCLNGTGLRKVARLTGSHLTMEVETTEPGLQLYCGSFREPKAAKGGRLWEGFVCLEAQGYPDALHHPNFPSILVKAGQTYCQTTVYRFL